MKFATVACLLVLAACKKEEAQVHSMAKSAPETAAPSMPDAPASAHGLAPAGWTAKPASGLRRATFVVPGGAGPADLSVITLSGDAGEELANVNRWRAQVGPALWSETAFKQASEKVPSRAGTLTVVDLGGPAQRMLVGMTNRDGETWFFMLLGPDLSGRSVAIWKVL